MSDTIVTWPDGESLTLDDARWRAIDRILPRDLNPVRLVYAAAHVVMLDRYRHVAHSPDAPGPQEEIVEHIDFVATMSFRRHLDALGFGIAEAMDTAQRFELGWLGAQRLIEQCGALDLANGFVAGAGTDHLPRINSRRDLIDGVLHQCAFIHDHGGVPIVLAQSWMTAHRCDEPDYVEVYGAIIRNAPCEILVHWLGPMFLPALEGYFPGDSFERIMSIDPSVCRGAKLSMLDASLERRLRASLRERQQIMLTGDDYHFGELMRGGPTETTTRFAGRNIALGDFSHGLLGIFDGIAAPAAIALRALAANRPAEYGRIMTACELLGRQIFEPPTPLYKTGLSFLAWLNGLQQNAMLVNHLEQTRSVAHLREVIRLANDSGAILDAPVAATRLQRWIDQRA